MWTLDFCQPPIPTFLHPLPPSLSVARLPTMIGAPRSIVGTVLGLALRAHTSSAFAFAPVTSRRMAPSSTTSSLDMARNRGLERREEGATPMRELHAML